jgi:hypothetical protein
VDNFTTEELAEELARREQEVYYSEPEPLGAPDYTKLEETVVGYVGFVWGDDYHEDNDYRHYIFEAAMEAVYGEEIWDQMRKRQAERAG